MSLGNIKQLLQQDFETNIYRIGMAADSIWRPTGDVVESDGSHPFCGLKLNCVGRMIYDYLNFNKPIWRSIEHANWFFVGGSTVPVNYYGLEHVDKVRLINVGNSASINITGYTTVVFWLEGGYSGQTISTGTVKVTVDEGLGFVDPSTTTLKGRKTPIRVGHPIVYEPIIDTMNTNITYPKSAYLPPASDNSYTSHLEIQYNNLDPLTTYTFKIESTNGVVRLGGCYYFSGKTCIVQYSAVPGVNWSALQRTIYNRVTINNFQLFLIQSLIYHDFFTVSEITTYTKNLIRQLKRDNKTRVVLVSCTPGGAVIENSGTTLGDEEPSYTQGQNFMKEFNHRRAFTITKPLYVDYPSRNAVYSVNIGGTDYNLRITTAKVSSESYDAWTYNNGLVFEFPTGCPIDSIVLPATATKISGSGGASFSLTSVRNMPPSFPVHVALMQSIAVYFRIQFVNLYQHFADLAVAVGETTETDPYPVRADSPLYADHPTGYENYLSRYFRPNHWDKSANQPAFEKIRDEVFLNFTFK